MTNKETAAAIRAYYQQHGRMGSIWGWPTDYCGYEQHIRFVEYRNRYWSDQNRPQNEFQDFALDYAERLSAGEFGPDPDDSLHMSGPDDMDEADTNQVDRLAEECQEDARLDRRSDPDE